MRNFAVKTLGTLKKPLIILFLILVATVRCVAYDFKQGNIFYNILSDSEPYIVEVTSKQPELPYNDGVTSSTIHIPDSVTNQGITYTVSAIGDYAFYGCTTLTQVIIPKSVTDIGAEAFEACTSLLSLAIEDGNPIYDSRDSCYAIIHSATNTLIAGGASSTIPSSVTQIAEGAFRLRTALTSITLPDSILRIGEEAFYGCSQLQSIYIPSRLDYIGQAAFGSCPSIQSISVAQDNNTFDSRDNCQAIISTHDSTLVAGCQRTEIPSSVLAIGDAAFEGCSTLVNIQLPEHLTSIGWAAFYGCVSLTDICIPSRVSHIGSWAFSGCEKLRSIQVVEGNPIYDSRDKCDAIIHTATGQLIAGCKSTKIPKDITTIGWTAFEMQNKITALKIPDNITHIEAWAFNQCATLKTITLPSQLTQIGKSIFDGCRKLKKIIVPKGQKDAYCALGLEEYRKIIKEK